MNNKKQEWNRLIIYLAFSFGLAFLWFFLSISKGQSWDDMSQRMQSFVALGMMFPMISHVLARWLTKEGSTLAGKDSMMLSISFENRKWIYFLLAILLPWVYTELGNVIALLLSPACYDSEYYLSIEIDKKLLTLLPLNAMVTGSIGSIAALGEEGGWRGYMMPKLCKLMPKAPALIFGGIIWGLWHAPLTCIGHNFGTDYPGFPYVGILCMCVMCIFMGILLTFVTEMSGSVWPAAIMHAVNNAGPSILNGYIDPDKGKWILGVSTHWLGLMISLMIVDLIVLIIWRKCRKKAEL